MKVESALDTSLFRLSGFVPAITRVEITFEHNLSVVESICRWVTVMVEGKVLTSGTMAQLRQHRGVVDAYLGREVSGLA